MRRLTSMLFAASLLVSIVPLAESGASPTRAWVDPFTLRGSGPRSAFVHVAPDAFDDTVQGARSLGLDVGARYDDIDVFIAYGTPRLLQRVARLPGVEAIEGNRKVHLLTESSHSATRSQSLLDGDVTLPDDTIINGAGVGVAIVDSGIDGTHPDFENRIVSNVKLLCPSHPTSVYVQPVTRPDECIHSAAKVAVPMEDTDTASAGGHGTHVSGIVAGSGSASGGRYHGAAPGASLYGVSIGTAVTVENAVDGLRWVLENRDQESSPDIRVVNNSWGTGTHARYDTAPDHFQSVTWKMQEALIDAGIVVVQAAGNTAGDGSAATTTPECVNPTPGVICVANYYDGDSGSRSGNIDGSSSRGTSDNAFVDTWPDVSAPGTNIVSTCRDTLPVCAALGAPIENPDNSYAAMTGTSMAAPHVAGIVAQLLQIDPTLTPAEVEQLLEDTAYKFTWGEPYGFVDPTNPDDATSFEKGHGLVDAAAAATALLDPDFEPAPDPEWPPPPIEPDLGPAGPDQRFYFRSTTRVNALDQQTETNAFTTLPPGLGSGAGAADPWPEAVADPSWSGAIEGPVQSLQIDFWVKSTDESTHDVGVPPLFHVNLKVGDDTYQLPTFSPSASQLDSVPRLITKKFQHHVLADGPDEGDDPDLERLNIDTTDELVAISITAEWFHYSGAIVYDSPDYPSGFSVNMTSPIGCPAEGAAAPTQLYLRSLTRAGNADAAAGFTTLDSGAPTSTEAARIEDVPLLRNPTPATSVDPIWRDGSVDGVICSLTVDFWQKQTLDEAILNKVHYYVTVWVGETPYTLNLEAPGSATSEVTRVTHTFTTMLDDFGKAIPLLIDGSDGPIAIEIAGQYVDADIETSIFYDSIGGPSSITINEGS